MNNTNIFYETTDSLHKVVNLKVEYSANPVGIDVTRPGLSWENVSERRLWIQSAYQILVSDNIENISNNIGNMWDSGKINSKKSINIKYEGKTLESAKRYYWRVRTWDKNNKVSEYSEINLWEMGLLKQEDWKAFWVSAPEGEDQSLPIFRRRFYIEKGIKDARIYICGLGHYELYLNGNKVGDRVLDPGWTNYKKSCLYTVYDAAKMLKTGENVLGVMLGNGMFNVSGGRYVYYKRTFGKIKFILQMKIDFEDGSSTLVISDENWKTTPGPITFSCIYGGEDYDARKQQEGWNDIGFAEDGNWVQVKIAEAPGGRLAVQMNPPNKVMKTFKPISIIEPEPGIYVYDLGQNFSGWVKFAVQGPSGSVVKFTPGELLTQKGTVSQKTSGSPYYFQYTLKGEAVEIWNPRFSYYGFRYVQVEGAVPEEECEAGFCGDKPVIKWLEGQMIHPDVEITGRFKCSNLLFNRIHEIINWSILSNMKSVLTDCPHREKLGWLEQTHLIGPAIMYNYGVRNLYRKVMNDIKEAQRDNGLVPDIAPEYIVFGYHEGFQDSPEWGSASVINPWYIYKVYGDLDILKDYYDVMARYVDYLTSRARNNILRHGLGDWLDVGPNPPYSHHTPVPITATAVYYYDIIIMEKVALLLGKKEDAEKYCKMAKVVRDAFNMDFFDNQTSRYVNGSQVSNSMPLFLDMVDEEYKEKVLNNLVKDIRLRGNHATGGDVGHPFILRALTRYDKSDVVADILKQKDSPSYGFQIENGATSLCESWDGPDKNRPHGSQNHFMLGSAEEWFYSGLAGIRIVHEDNSLDKIVIKPCFTDGIEWVRAYHKNPYGRIEVEWRALPDDCKLELNITVPANTTAVVYIPSNNTGFITEGKKELNEAEGIKLVEVNAKYTVLKTGSGRYSFTIICNTTKKTN